MHPILCSRAPTRISFAGGGTDIPEIASKIGGCVTSAAISRYVYGSLRRRADKKICMRSVRMDGTAQEMTIDADKIVYDGRLDLIKSVVQELGQGNGFDITLVSEVPEHSGLGASGAAYAALIALFNAHYKSGMSRGDIAELSFGLERGKLQNAVGRQDQYAACFGGLNFIEFKKDMGVSVSPLKISESTAMELEKNIALLYVADRGKTAGSIISGQAKNPAAFLKTKELGIMARHVLEKNDLQGFAKVMSLVWQYKKKFSPETTNSFIEKIHNAAVKNGAYGGKISGAGGGGCGFWFCHGGKKNAVIASLEALGARNLHFKFDFSGVKTWRI